MRKEACFQSTLSWLCLVVMTVGFARSAAGAAIQFPADLQGYVGSKACAVCHLQIAKTYAKTPMAQASGRAADLRLPGGDVFAAKAGVTYSTSWDGAVPQLRYRKKMADGSMVEGTEKLAYYVGSGAHARGFIFEEQGQPFEAPVGYYGDQRKWDLAPGYEKERSIFLGRKVETACLDCHASGLQTGGKELFREGAVSCERCHGPGQEHVAAVQSGRADGLLHIVNPSKLEPERRDSVCAQCHLTGETRVMKASRSETTFRPGDRLAQHVVPFVWASPDAAELKVIGHFEGLQQSKCKRASGDKLSCLTCHDPHTTVPEAEKIAYYRGKCLTCHQEESCKLSLAARKQQSDSCIACHMEKRNSTDGQHTAFTDHSIPGKVREPREKGHSDELVAFWPAGTTERDTALAYADEAWLKRDVESVKQAQKRLRAVWARGFEDADVAAQLGYTDDLSGDAAEAETLYRAALKADPENLVALTNLAAHLARDGQTEQAITLWRKALQINPGLLAPGLNLARTEEAVGHGRTALEIIGQVLRLNPDSERALALQRNLLRGRQ